MKRVRPWTCTCASSFVCTSPWAVTTVVGLLDLRSVSSSPEAYVLFGQHVHRCSGVDHEFSLFWLFPKRRRHYPGFGRRAYLCPPFWAKRHPSPGPMLLCGRIAPVLGFSSCVLSSIFGAHGIRSHFRMTPCDGPLLSRVFTACNGPLGEFDCVIRSQFSNFPAESTFSDCHLGTHINQLYSLLQ